MPSLHVTKAAGMCVQRAVGVTNLLRFFYFHPQRASQKFCTLLLFSVVQANKDVETLRAFARGMTPPRKTEEVTVGTVKAGNHCLWFTQSINSSDVDICDALFSSFLRFLHGISRILDLDQFCNVVYYIYCT